MKKKTLIILGGILFITTITGCNSNGSRKEIEARFEGFVSLYPTNNLMDFYDKEGDRNQDFDENDKGTWVIGSYIRQNIDENLYSEGMTLRFDRNKKQATGYYHIRTYSQKHGDTEIEYPVYYDEAGIHLVEDIEDEVLKDKILNFKFSLEYISLENNYMSSLELINKRYNSEAPLYNVTYRIKQDDENLQNIREQNNITQDFTQQPRLRIEGKGRIEWGRHSNRTIQFSFDDDKSVYIRESISFRRSEGMRE